ncbi:uncharacterized protein PG986_008027 [Apiospora aurea]|uniref:Uncharacterized protein n=1 Tax=Apiospora aurea TaxID=335848 RepID=A0ABR1QE98_9PEZI
MNMADLIAKIAKASRKRLGIAAIHTSQVRMTSRLAGAKEAFSLGFSGGTSTTSGARSSHHRPPDSGNESAAVAAAAAAALERPFGDNPAPFENNLKDVRFTDAGGLLVDCDGARQSTRAEDEPDGERLEGKKPAAPMTETVVISPDQDASKDV